MYGSFASLTGPVTVRPAAHRLPPSRLAPIVVERPALWPTRAFPTILSLILLGLGMMLLPVLLPFVAGRRLFGRRRSTPIVF